MQNILKNLPSDSPAHHPWILLLILGGYVFAALFIFSILAQAAILPFFDFDYQAAIRTLSPPYYSGEARWPLLIVQGITSIGAFLLVPVLFIRWNLKLRLKKFISRSLPAYQPVIMTVIIMFSLMVVNSVIIEWNQSVEFPEVFSGLESYLQEKESQLEDLTNYLTTFDSGWQFLAGLLMLAVIPAVGEELLFRGLIQNLFGQAFKNHHLAIWLTAFLFGAFHFQFYGLIPRMFLGVLFGYLYLWSGQLSIAMLGHFINNGFTLIILYMNQTGWIDYDPAATESTPSLTMVLIFVGIGSLLLYLFRNYFRMRAHE